MPSVITNPLKRLRIRMSNNFGCSGGPVSRQSLGEGTSLLSFDEQSYTTLSFAVSAFYFKIA